MTECAQATERERVIPKDEWVWYGYAGHLIVSRDCEFHMSTRIGGYLVSTVGDYRPDRDGHMRAIGGGPEDYFETMVFKCDGEDDYGNPKINYAEIECVRYAKSRDAEVGHHEMCARVARGEVSND